MTSSRRLRTFAVPPGLVVAALVLVHAATSGLDRPAHQKPAPEKLFTANEEAFFQKDVLPILKANCFKCHGGESKIRGGLRLTTRATILRGGDTGPAVSLDKPDDSLLLKAIHHRDGLEMPPKGKLSAKEIEALTKWVKIGLPFTSGAGTVSQGREEKGSGVTEKAHDYWAYNPVKRPDVPDVTNKDWVRNPIDALILAKLEAKGLAPAPPADRVALARRVHYDLTGLPPTPEEVDAFLTDRSPDAYEKVIDRLLESPQYGEKWGRHWLDLVRYAETNGYERDGPKPFAWRYRDYVIRSFNEDKPYDHFIREQLAGDEMPGYNPDAVIATGYYRLGIWDDEPADPQQARYDELDDIVATTAQVFLGMTMNCARCHDHKIDPIPQADYYRMLAFFQDVPHFSDSRDVHSRFNLTDISPPAVRAGYEQELTQREARISELKASMTKIEDDAIKKMPAEDQRAAAGNDRPQVIARNLKQFQTPEQDAAYGKLKAEFAKLRKLPNPARDLALSVNNCLAPAPTTHVLIRGNPHAPGNSVEPAFPTVLGHAAPAFPAPAEGARTSGRRGVLANWIASPDNQLTARVMVNRIWHYHFGRGIVATPNDFGKFGTLPTHPELLDWLAQEFVGGGWHVKRMHRLILQSNVYRMSVRADETGLRVDPANTLLWRFHARRLTAEEVRDSILAISGRLNLKAGGPSIYAPIPKEVLAGQSVPGQGWGRSPPEEAARRSVYVHVKRSLLVPILSTHDQADTDSSCPVRYTTTVPTQALGMLNGEFANEQAAAFAERLRREAPNDLAAQVRRAIRLTTSRNAAAEEVKQDVAFVKALQAKGNLSERDALKHYCLLALNTNEFIYLD